mmetsp:Transcript_14182/g.26684  ORF Transcript_14182/g.26684 Transcript_14182/m.26684 type:complete len:201 (+) Transcript_14182:1479-2081(+)
MELRATRAMCAVCFDVLIAKLSKQSTKDIESAFVAAEPLSSIACPVFVTWTTGPEHELRGCIGTFDDSMRIAEVVPKYAKISAFDDSRFPPVSERELPELNVSVSLLTNFTQRPDVYDWEVGTHGVQINIRRGTRRFSSTFLPEVASEQGWDKDTTLSYLLRKAGLREPTILEGDQVEFTTYESSKCTLTYGEYRQLRVS